MVDGLELVMESVVTEVCVCLDLWLCLMEVHVVWTQRCSQFADFFFFFTCCPGVMPPVCTGLLIGPDGL